MGRLIVIEGLDGAGKNTLTSGLIEVLTAKGASVARHAFPRYGLDVHADLAADALHGRLGDITESVHGMALLFALDRRAAAEGIRADLATVDVVLLDRYVASNAAYGAARLNQDADGEFVAWVRALEIGRFAVPVPDAHVLLSVPVEVASSRAEHRERLDAARGRDAYESDNRLQIRCGRVYEQLAQRDWLSPWYVVDGSGEVDVESLATRLWS